MKSCLQHEAQDVRPRSFPDWLLNRVILGDCLHVLPDIPDKSIPVIITDPPWPGTDVTFDVDAVPLFIRFARQAARITDRLIVILGCDTDPRFLRHIPAALSFFRVCWLRRIPSSYRGSLLYSADIAYVFGHAKLNGVDRVMGGEWTAVLQRDRDNENTHPTRRHIEHMSWLVRTFSRPGDLILDPFAGSGSTLVAAKRAGRPYCGIEINATYADYAVQRLQRETSLFEQA